MSLPARLLLIVTLVAGAMATAETRSKKLDFENEIIEGENKRSLDSLTQISEGYKRKRMRLYEKGRDFKTETQETLRKLIEER